MQTELSSGKSTRLPWGWNALLHNVKLWHEGEFLPELRCTAGEYHTSSHNFNDNLLFLRRGEGGQMCILVQQARAVTHSLAQPLQRWWRGKMKHNAFSRLPGATNASKLVFMFYYILNFSTLKTIKEIAFSQRVFLQGMYFKFTVFSLMSLSVSYELLVSERISIDLHINIYLQPALGHFQGRGSPRIYLKSAYFWSHDQILSPRARARGKEEKSTCPPLLLHN